MPLTYRTASPASQVPPSNRARATGTSFYSHSAWGAGVKPQVPRAHGGSLPAAISRQTLVVRLGSALQSLTGRAGDAGEGGRLAGNREGRPGALGTRYTQHAGRSAFEGPSIQPLKKDQSIRRGVDSPAVPTDKNCEHGDAEPMSSCKAAPTAGAEAPARKDRGSSEGAPLPVESPRIGDPGRQEETSVMMPPDGEPGARSDGETPIPGGENPSVGVGAQTSGTTQELDTAARTDIHGDASSAGNPMERIARGIEAKEPRKPRAKKAGLWELKAERSRLEQSLAEAEADRDWGRIRVEELQARLEEAASRLESLRRHRPVEI